MVSNWPIWPFIWKHRTKALGMFQVAVGAALTQLPNLQATLRPVHYGLICMGLGVTTAVLGYANSMIIRNHEIDNHDYQ